MSHSQEGQTHDRRSRETCVLLEVLFVLSRKRRGELVKFLSDLRFRRGADSEFVLPRLEEWEHGEQARVT